MTQAYMNWSGGKDSSLCLQRVLEEGTYKVQALLTSVNTVHNRISMHGVRRELLEAQAASIGIPLQTLELGEQPDMKEYEQATMGKVAALKKQGCTHALFGDIFLEDLRRYREEQLQSQDVHCVFPLWKIPTADLMREFLERGFKAVVVCVNSRFLDQSFCGRLLDDAFIRDLPENVDPCGENGEYHSFVFEGPLFRAPIAYQKGEIVYREYKAPAVAPDSTPANSMDQGSKDGFYFCDLLAG
ncbi:MAG TPA: hypothetical protein VNS58_17340 [Puia sp.]|nr:hypothetical protein [Puia sp.]